LITGGVSAGKFDLVEPALERAGARFHFTGVRIQPGKPLVFGEIPRSRIAAGISIKKAGASAASTDRVMPFFGLPGNPVSSAVTFLLFAAPVLAALSGNLEVGPRFALAQPATGTHKQEKAGLTRFLPARWSFGAAGQMPKVELVAWQGVVAPAGVPRPIVDQLAAQIDSLVADPATRDKLTAIALEPLPGSTPDSFAAYVKTEVGRWADIVRKSGAELE